MKKIITAILFSAMFLTIYARHLNAQMFPKFAPNAANALYQTPPAPEFSDAQRQAELARRRRAAADKMQDKSVMILFSAAPKIYTGDVDFVYRQENNLFYLTELKQKGATLVLSKNAGVIEELLFLPKPDPGSETWNGKMDTAEDARRISGIKNVFYDDKLPDLMKAVKSRNSFLVSNGENLVFNHENLYLLLPDGSESSEDLREFQRETEFVRDFAEVSVNDDKEYVYAAKLGYKIFNGQPIFAALRLVKSAYEIKMLQHAVDITTEAHERVWSKIGGLKWEYEAQAEVEYVFRRRNADYWGYPSIVGCGANGTTLHYEESQSKITPNTLLLMDVGAEYGHYSADVTRTFPVSGKFSKEQAEIYQIVYDAQEAAAAVIKPGADYDDASDAAEEVLKNGLAKLGLITAPDALIPGTEKQITNERGEKEIIGVPQYTIWYMHGWGHWLGMNVHDVGVYDKFAEGMVTTNEPGIYVRADALDYLPNKPETKQFIEKIRPAFEKYKNIGVRIEDDMLVTKTGAVWLTKNLPRKMSEIEALMRKQ